MQDDINRFVESAAILDDAVAARERVIETQRAEIAKLNQIVDLLIQKVEWFSALVAGIPAPVPPAVPVPVPRPVSAPENGICQRCRQPFHAGRGFRKFCRPCRSELVKEGIENRPPAILLEKPHVH